MQLTLTSALLMAGVASAQMSSSASPSSAPATYTPITSTVAIPSFSIPPTSVFQSRLSAIPTSSYSAISAADSSAAASAVNTDDYDCVYRGWGCDWIKSEYGYGSDYCGSSPFKAGQQLSDGNQIVAVSSDGSGDCASKAGSKCCKVLADSPCKHGEKYLECTKP
ncbi:hypothetical protein N7448_003621 [Penicillium atrosanguineum]|uniref:Uncharacterized protein n=1 Tax=Penicillium atrosanguineum TaxID=1132637 RepID=A0A9W9H864_9EURO|nr:uncharacterized protein N7443_002591 [Penicillium atrosanguineum]KAJ5122487.1 hypothetical protein N7526_009424 [Penicillium atrosanguineum]KAJ5140213.1 hypothetical protein N7448_003621 [Penicillium atrosanguineum]KAJ5310130.1 hypothetical protein N7443_002591 [Penicillium atrosanguineum]KAJ5315646.1 hypothetical protein N7476_005953 [Penicillium atrosanguineum]